MSRDKHCRERQLFVSLGAVFPNRGLRIPAKPGFDPEALQSGFGLNLFFWSGEF